MEELITIPVLVIDDDDFMLDIMREALDSLRPICKAQFFDNEPDFEASITSETHVALIDHIINGRQVGMELIEKFESKRKTNIPSRIIVVSGQTNEDVMIEYINRKKVDAYVRKPEVKDGIEGVKQFQTEIISYTEAAINKTIQWIKWFATLKQLSS